MVCHQKNLFPLWFYVLPQKNKGIKKKVKVFSLIHRMGSLSLSFHFFLGQVLVLWVTHTLIHHVFVILLIVNFLGLCVGFDNLSPS